MAQTRRLWVTAVLLVLAGLPAARAQTALRLGTTTSTYETGLLDHLLPPFEQAHGIQVHVLSTGTGKALRLAENGDVDLILVHDRQDEERFVAQGLGVNRRDVMYNDFVLLGPASDPAAIRGLADAAAALGRIAGAGQTFVSRGDDSGTHRRERALWAQAGLSPAGTWYLEAGQGMSATLRLADEKNAYLLSDRSTYLYQQGELRLPVLVEGGPELRNPYGVIAVSPYRHAHVQYEAAMALIAWLTSPACQERIAAYRKDGHVLFHPGAAPAP
ncbi:MAG: substrate-binding domain-containing protein [Candidatus Latescibacterota bacterium]